MKYTYFLVAVSLGTVISSGAKAQAANDQKNINTANSVNEVTKLGLAGGVATITSFSSREDTRGSRYISSDWMKGVVTDTAGNTYNNPQYYFNYDKITHDLYLTSDKKEVVELDHSQIKSFSLSSYTNGKLEFVQVPAIEPGVYFQSLVESPTAYTLYKLTKTKFEKANYKSTGLVESGKNYDEYVDHDSYYLGMPGGTDFRQIELSKKSLKKALAGNAKAETFFKDHKSDPVDEHFAQALVSELNQN